MCLPDFHPCTRVSSTKRQDNQTSDPLITCSTSPPCLRTPRSCDAAECELTLHNWGYCTSITIMGCYHVNNNSSHIKDNVKMQDALGVFTNMYATHGHGLDMRLNEKQYKRSNYLHSYPKEIGFDNSKELRVECTEMQYFPSKSNEPIHLLTTLLPAHGCPPAPLLPSADHHFPSFT